MLDPSQTIEKTSAIETFADNGPAPIGRVFRGGISIDRRSEVVAGIHHAIALVKSPSARVLVDFLIDVDVL
jgi:hypothetical protein